MPRGPRIPLNQAVGHLIFRGNNHLHICKDDEDFIALKNRLLRFLPFYKIDVYHYGFMHTHLHLLAFIHDAVALAHSVKAWQISYFHYFKKKYGYDGHLWHGRYRGIPILEEVHFLQCGRYIEINPLEAGLVKDPKDYPWTSYHFYAEGATDPLVTPNPQYLDWGSNPKERQEKYRKFIMLDSIFDSNQSKSVKNPMERPLGFLTVV